MSPEQAHQGAEFWYWLAKSRPEREYQVCLFAYYGHTTREIAERLGVHPVTVRRDLCRVTGAYEKMQRPRVKYARTAPRATT